MARENRLRPHDVHCMLALRTYLKKPELDGPLLAAVRGKQARALLSQLPGHFLLKRVSRRDWLFPRTLTRHLSVS